MLPIYLLGFIACLIAGAFLFWYYKRLSSPGKRTRKTGVAGPRNRLEDDIASIPLHSAINDKNHLAPAALARAHAAHPADSSPWGRRDDDDEPGLDGPVVACPDGSKTDSRLLGFGAKAGPPGG